ncbi:MAG: peptidyl-prolyl cis-trans isomerase [Myxococcales bacterium]|nr:peptidyl-prolyl cis-trans isomerase [Myxococcales bacterium]
MATLAAVGCDRSPRATADPAVAMVGGRSIPRGAVRELADQARDDPEAGKRALQDLIEEELILREAETLGVFVTEAELDDAQSRLLGEAPAEGGDDLEASDRARWRPRLRRRLLVEKVVALEVTAKIDITPDEIARAYEAAAGPEGDGRFRVKERVLARQIFTAEADAAEKALARLRKDEAFDAVAREVSEAPEAARGGWMGYIEKDTLPKELDDALFGLPVGGRCDGVIQSPYGYHLFEVIAREPARELRLEEVEDRIRRELTARAEQEAYRAWIASLAEEYPVTQGKAAP